MFFYWHQTCICVSVHSNSVSFSQIHISHTHTHTHLYKCTSVLYNKTQWSGFGWGTSYIILTMYSVVNKKVSGWELALCNNKMHELSTAGPSVSILPLDAVRRKHVSCSDRFYCTLSVVCAFSVYGAPLWNLITIDLLGLSLLIVHFSPFALCFILINVVYYNNTVILKHFVSWDFVL